MFDILYANYSKNESSIFSDNWDIKQKANVHDVGSGDQTTSIGSGIYWTRYFQFCMCCYILYQFSPHPATIVRQNPNS